MSGSLHDTIIDGGAMASSIPAMQQVKPEQQPTDLTTAAASLQPMAATDIAPSSFDAPAVVQPLGISTDSLPPVTNAGEDSAAAVDSSAGERRVSDSGVQVARKGRVLTINGPLPSPLQQKIRQRHSNGHLPDEDSAAEDDGADADAGYAGPTAHIVQAPVEMYATGGSSQPAAVLLPTSSSQPLASLASAVPQAGALQALPATAVPQSSMQPAAASAHHPISTANTGSVAPFAPAAAAPVPEATTAPAAVAPPHAAMLQPVALSQQVPAVPAVLSAAAPGAPALSAGDSSHATSPAAVAPPGSNQAAAGTSAELQLGAVAAAPAATDLSGMLGSSMMVTPGGAQVGQSSLTATAATAAPVFRSVHYDKDRNRWQVLAWDGGQYRIIGEYNNENEALLAQQPMITTHDVMRQTTIPAAATPAAAATAAGSTVTSTATAAPVAAVPGIQLLPAAQAISHHHMATSPAVVTPHNQAQLQEYFARLSAAHAHLSHQAALAAQAQAHAQGHNGLAMHPSSAAAAATAAATLPSSMFGSIAAGNHAASSAAMVDAHNAAQNAATSAGLMAHGQALGGINFGLAPGLAYGAPTVMGMTHRQLVLPPDRTPGTFHGVHHLTTERKYQAFIMDHATAQVSSTMRANGAGQDVLPAANLHYCFGFYLNFACSYNARSCFSYRTDALVQQHCIRSAEA